MHHLQALRLKVKLLKIRKFRRNLLLKVRILKTARLNPKASLRMKWTNNRWKHCFQTMATWLH